MNLQIGFIGLGTMGLPMARNLLKNNGQLLVSDLDKRKKEEIQKEGAVVAVNNIEVMQKCDVVFLSLPTIEAVENVVAELVENGRQGQYIIDTSTIGYKQSTVLAKNAESKGIQYIDAPVSGGAEKAGKGTLSVIVGASEEAFEKNGIGSLLRIIGSEIHYTGKQGNGVALKILNNMLSKAILYADGEIISLAEHMGIPFDVLYNVIQSSSSQNEIFRIKKEHIQQHEYMPTGKSYSPITMSLKDLKLARELCDELDVASFNCNNMIQWYRIALRRGYEKKDSSSIVELLRELQPLKEEQKCIGGRKCLN